MSDSSGSILQLPSKTTALSNVNLLIVTDSPSHYQAIVNVLNAAETKFSYDFASIDHSVADKPAKKYNAVLYDNHAINNSRDIAILKKKIQWWCHLYADIPLILITETLGDEQAVKLVKLGVSGYVVRNNIQSLPEVLQETSFDFVSKQTISSKQEDLIGQQAEIIQQLEQEKQDWLEQQQTKKQNISHLNHELRSPISSIVGFARMLKEQYYGALNPKQMQYVSGILSSGEHLLALVKNYLDIVKIEANKQSLDLERLAVGDICQAAVFIVAEKAKAKGLDLFLKLDPAIDFCIADSLRLKQILINLLSNATKFTDSGSITLKVTLAEGLLYFAVIDTGTGISKQNIHKLFKPFPQITSHQESTGLGLALSRKLAQLHGGDITVTSELDKGSCFTLRIPQYQ
ncbi:MAG: HAMP domain-containing sensor histidine kinase [Cyanobacteria bacterium P01_G01_bin.19]